MGARKTEKEARVCVWSVTAEPEADKNFWIFWTLNEQTYESSENVDARKRTCISSTCQDPLSERCNQTRAIGRFS
jgi:hypothetical protein